MNRNGAIDFLKFLFGLQIVVFHAKNFAGGEDYIFTLGAIGVEFSLSSPGI